MSLRENWTDKEWAEHIGTTEKHIKELRELISKNYLPVILQHRETKKYHFAIERVNMSPSGMVRYCVQYTASHGFDTHEAAARDANENLIPSMELTATFAKSNNLPIRALQLLHVKEK